MTEEQQPPAPEPIVNRFELQIVADMEVIKAADIAKAAQDAATDEEEAC